MIALLAQIKEKLIRNKPYAAVGLNIGVSSIKMVKLRFSKEATQLAGFRLEQCQLDLEAPLKEIFEAESAKRVSISVSGQQAITRYIDLPRMKPEELKQALKFEAQKHIPFPVAEVNLDAFILRQDLPDNKMRVLLAAVKKDFLNQRLKLLTNIGFEVDLVDIDSLALINAFNFNYGQEENVKNSTIGLLNIGSATSNLNILESGMPSLSRDINIGGNHLTQRIGETLGFDFKAAENIKTTPEKQKSEKILEAIEPVMAKLAQEVRTSFDYYESRSVSSVNKIFISGGGSLYPGMPDLLSGLVGIEVSTWDPLRRILFADNLDPSKIKPLSGQLAVAVGLALRSLA